MTSETFTALFDKFAEKYGVKFGDAKRSKYRGVTYDIPDEDADTLFEDVCRRFRKAPDVAAWREICNDYRLSKRIVQNAEHCFACNDDGYVFWSENHNPRSAVCPFCDRGASIKRRYPRMAYAERDIAEAVRQRNAYTAEKDTAKRRAMIAHHVVFMATNFDKERGIEL